MRFLIHGISTQKLAGIETYLINIQKFMPDDVFFDFIIEGEDTIHRSAIEERGGKIIPICPRKHIVKSALDWNRLLKSKRGDNETAKVVYFNMYSLAWIVPIFICKINGYNVIIHAHNNNLYDCGLLHRMLHFNNRILVRFMKIYRFTNSELSARLFFGKYPAEMIYNAIDTIQFKYNQETRNTIRSGLDLNDKNVYGFAGRLENSKNPFFLIDVFTKISEIDKKAAFLVCGNGSLRSQTEEYANSNHIKVTFTGSVTNIQDYYQAMDLFILPSRSEGLGLVLIEAQATGLPCVASKGVIPEKAKVSQLLEYIELDQGAEKWAKMCVDKISHSQDDRSSFSAIVQDTQFEIRKEAPRLAELLKQCANTNRN